MATDRRQPIRLSPDEEGAFFGERKKGALATIDKDRFPHVVAMNYFARDGAGGGTSEYVAGPAGSAGQRAEARGTQDRSGEGGQLGPPQARRTIQTGAPHRRITGMGPWPSLGATGRAQPVWGLGPLGGPIDED